MIGRNKWKEIKARTQRKYAKKQKRYVLEQPFIMSQIAMRKQPFRKAKGLLLDSKRTPLEKQESASWNVIGLLLKKAYLISTFKGLRSALKVSAERSFHSLNVRTSFLLHAEPK